MVQTAEADLRALLGRLREVGNVRKLRLAACACCRRAWRLLGSESSRRAVALAERSADGHLLGGRLESAYLDVRQAAKQQTSPAHAAAAQVATAAADPYLRRPERAAALVTALERLSAVSAGAFREPFGALLADILGPAEQPPFRPEWRTPTAIGLAQRVLEERDEVAMLVLADALEEAGCVDDALLAHCRSDTAHARGCWALDAVLRAE